MQRPALPLCCDRSVPAKTSGFCLCSGTLVQKRFCSSRGDKGGDWSGWYASAIPVADRLYEVYLTELRAEGLLE